MSRKKIKRNNGIEHNYVVMHSTKTLHRLNIRGRVLPDEGVKKCKSCARISRMRSRECENCGVIFK